MTKRRSRGDGGLHWSTARQRWIATASLGFDGRGKRINKTGSGRTKTEAKNKLKEVLRDYEDGLAIAPDGYTVEHAVRDWLTYGLSDRDPETLATCTSLADNHVVPELGRTKLRDLSAEDVERWLRRKAKTHSTRTLQAMRSCLNRSVRRAMARDKVKRNVVDLCAVPTGRPGRPSKALTLSVAVSLLQVAFRGAVDGDGPAARMPTMCAYIVLSVMTGARTEELRALQWDHVDLVGDEDATPPVPPYMAVWRSVRAGNDTKTRKSRRTVALPGRCVDVLAARQQAAAEEKTAAGVRWSGGDLVFATSTGHELDAANVRRGFRFVLAKVPGIDPQEWTPRELRHSFVSLLSDRGVPLEDISRLVGHSGSNVTERVYRKQIRPVIQTGAVVMDDLFGGS